MSAADNADFLSQQTSTLWKMTYAANEAIALPMMSSAPVWLCKILSKCRLAVIEQKELFVICPDKLTVKALNRVPRRRALATVAYQKGFKWISIFSDSTKAIHFAAEDYLIKKEICLMISSLLKQNTPMKEVLDFVMQSPHGTSVVRLSDSVCLFTNNEPHRIFTGLDPTEYLGRSVANLWIPDETERLHRYLKLDGQVTEYEYRGYRKIDVMQGIYNPISFVGDFWVVEDFYGHRCRVAVLRFK